MIDRRRLDEDTSRQETALEDAREVLRTALRDLSYEAHMVAKRKRITVDDLLGVYGEVGGVKRAEQNVDTAVRDLQGAAGEDT